MSKRMVYLAYPIDNANLSEQQVRRINNAKTEMHEDHGVLVCYDPGDAFSVAPSSQVGAEISIVNNSAIDASQAMLAWMPQGVSSIGVPMEIARAAMAGKPVAVISDTWSWALAGAGERVRIFKEGHESAAIEWLIAQPGSIRLDELEPMPVAGVRGFDTSGRLPTRAHGDDAGLDLYVAEDTTLPWGEFVDVPCGIKVELPSWSWGLLVGRSSTFRRRQIEVQVGIIDAGYRGELFAACIWRPDGWTERTGFFVDEKEDPITERNTASTLVKAGERLAQLIIIPNGTADVEPVQVAELSEHERGDAGFGSSGA